MNVILVDEKDEPVGIMEKLEVHQKEINELSKKLLK